MAIGSPVLIYRCACVVVSGPGMYNPLLKGHVGNMMGNHDARFKTILRDEIPGPGTYEVGIDIQT